MRRIEIPHGTRTETSTSRYPTLKAAAEMYILERFVVCSFGFAERQGKTWPRLEPKTGHDRNPDCSETPKKWSRLEANPRIGKTAENLGKTRAVGVQDFDKIAEHLTGPALANTGRRPAEDCTTVHVRAQI